MTFSLGLSRGALLLLAGLALSGCLRSTPSQMDEEKESHFMLGRSRVTAMDYPGAIDSFGRALEVNPKSGAAHFELACLYEKRETDPAAAIYHYQQYLKLRPKAENAETVNQHIMALKQELARTVSLGPVTERQQREFERLAEENRRLNEEVEKWRTYAMRLQALTNQASAVSTPPRQVKQAGATQSAPNSSGTSSTASTASRPVLTGSMQRTHTIKAGETAKTIARQYGVRLEALLAANPRIEPRRLQVGQTLNIPASGF
jgi:tetratricopeptide (TPR) repeat protein